jgi:hypothetical protein
LEKLFKKKYDGFIGTEFKYPLLYALYGSTDPAKISKLEPGEEREPFDELIYAEFQESQQDDNHLYFITDDSIPSICHRLNERTNGWILIIGLDKNIDIHSLAVKLKRKRLTVFVSGSSERIFNANFLEYSDLSPRDTGRIYFAQLLVRYALIYGRELGGLLMKCLT